MQQLNKRMHNTFITIAGLVILAFSTFAFASPDGKPSFAPKIPHPTNGSTECVQPEDEMKKNHMNYILHQRDQTVHDGIRTKQYSLKECINCHVPKDTEVRYGDKQHFCSSCHLYTGVSIDCFQCHMDRPMGVRPLAFTPANNPHNTPAASDINTASSETTETATTTTKAGANNE